VSSTLRHTLPPLRTEAIVSRNELEINPICLLGGKKISTSHFQDWLSIWSLERANFRHTKTETKVSHTVQRICNPLLIGNAAVFSASTALLLHKLFTFCAYFSRLSVIHPTPVVSPSKAWDCGLSLSLILGSNPSGDINVCLWCVLCVIR
jgi:hypothetical protein